MQNIVYSRRDEDVKPPSIFIVSSSKIINVGLLQEFQENAMVDDQGDESMMENL